jgi:multicomponent Na+:H+ antiporter subunit E
MTSSMNRRSALVRRSLAGITILTVLWIVLVQGDTRSPSLAVATVLAAGAIGLVMGSGRGWRLRVRGILTFIPFFAWTSLQGAMDVVGRAIAWRRPLAPALIQFDTRLDPDGAPAVFFLEVMSLLPGTLCVDVEYSRIVVHVIDRERPNVEVLRQLETRVAAFFGAVLPGPTKGA